MPRIKVSDLNLDLAEVMKKDPQMNKIRGGAVPGASLISKAALTGASVGRTAGLSGGTIYCTAETIYCCTGYSTGCESQSDTISCGTTEKTGCSKAVA